jgi:hypothetical protein
MWCNCCFDGTGQSAHGVISTIHPGIETCRCTQVAKHFSHALNELGTDKDVIDEVGGHNRVMDAMFLCLSGLHHSHKTRQWRSSDVSKAGLCV